MKLFHFFYYFVHFSVVTTFHARANVNGALCEVYTMTGTITEKKKSLIILVLSTLQIWEFILQLVCWSGSHMTFY